MFKWIKSSFEEISKLKEQSGKNIVIWGNMMLAHSFLKEELLDEIQLRVIPTTLGKGKPVFDRAYDLEFLDSKTYDKGLVLLRYTLES
jgi:dihydrofolate reductase